MKDYKAVIFEGIPGAGKTAASSELASLLGPGTLYMTEPDDRGDANPYLSDYYADPDRWAFTMQIHLLQARYRAHLNVQWHVKSGEGNGVIDRSYFGDVAFAHVQRELGHLPRRDFDTYRSLYECMTANVQYPNVCVFLDVDPEVSLHRIEARMEGRDGRTCERKISLDYLQYLDKAIRHMVSVLEARGTKIISVPWNKDQSTSELRNGSMEKLAAQITEIPFRREFVDLFERKV